MANLLDFLTAEGRREIIRNILPGFIEEGYSGNQSLEILRGQGLGISRSDFQEIYRDVLGIEIRSGRIKNVPEFNVPSDAVFDTSRYDQPEKYRIIFKGTYTDPTTGDNKDMFYGWDTSSVGTIQEMEASALEDVQDNYGEVGFLLSTFRAVKGFIGANFS